MNVLSGGKGQQKAAREEATPSQSRPEQGRLDNESFGWICMMTKLWFDVIPNWHFGREVSKRLQHEGITPSEQAIVWIDSNECQTNCGERAAIFKKHKTIWCRMITGSIGAAKIRLAKAPGEPRPSHVLLRALKGTRHTTLCVSWINFSSADSTVLEALPAAGLCQEWRSKAGKSLFSFKTELNLWAQLQKGDLALYAPTKLPFCSKEDEDRLFAKAPINPFNVKALKLFRSKLKDHNLLEKVIKALSVGHNAEFAAEGLDQRYRDFSRPESSEEEIKFKLGTLEKYAVKGFVFGPFAYRPPFPNSKKQSASYSQ